MDYEKKYKEALERAKSILEIGVKDTRDKKIILSFFPELKEINEEEIRKAMINFFKSERKEGDTVLHYGVNIESMIAWLEKQGEQKPWSEEDERLLNNMVIVIQDYYNKEDAQSLISWLKSLRPQTTWKPSDKQMEAIRIAAEVGTANDSWAMKILKEMYNDLNHKE